MGGDKELQQLEERLRLAFGKYSYLRNFWISLGNMEEDYGETLEELDPGAWNGFSDGKITEKASEMLRVTEELFEKMTEESGREMMEVVAQINALGDGAVEKILKMQISDGRLDEMEAEDFYMWLTGEGQDEDL